MEMIEYLESIDKTLKALLQRWDDKEQKATLGGKKTMTTGVHTPLTPEQEYYHKLGERNKGSIERY